MGVKWKKKGKASLTALEVAYVGIKSLSRSMKFDLISVG